jgi:hypothetical protein
MTQIKFTPGWTFTPYTPANYQGANFTFGPEFGHHELSVSHGVSDAKGRAIGGCAVIRPDVRTGGVGTANGMVWTSTWDGTWKLMILSERDGKSFGPGSRNGMKFATLVEAMSAGEKGLKAQGARYRKAK